LIKGKNNEIIIKKGCVLRDCRIKIFGNGNKIYIGENCDLNQCEFWIEDDEGEILLKENSNVMGNTRFIVLEGQKISLGEDCMLSKDIIFRTGDSHSITDLQNNRLNPSKSIKIGNHVWVGNKVIVLKGVEFPENSIIGTGAVVTKPFTGKHIIVAGNPAKIIKTDINWDRKRF